MNTTTLDLSPFDSKPEIYRSTALLISKSKAISDEEAAKWIEFVAVIPKVEIVQKIHDYFTKEGGASREHEAKTLALAKKISPTEYQKIFKQQMEKERETMEKTEKISDSFDDRELKKIEQEMEKMS